MLGDTEHSLPPLISSEQLSGAPGRQAMLKLTAGRESLVGSALRLSLN